MVVVVVAAAAAAVAFIVVVAVVTVVIVVIVAAASAVGDAGGSGGGGGGGFTNQEAFPSGGFVLLCNGCAVGLLELELFFLDDHLRYIRLHYITLLYSTLIPMTLNYMAPLMSYSCIAFLLSFILLMTSQCRSVIVLLCNGCAVRLS